MSIELTEPIEALIRKVQKIRMRSSLNIFTETVDGNLSDDEKRLMKEKTSDILKKAAELRKADTFRYVLGNFGSNLTTDELLKVIDDVPDERQYYEVLALAFLGKCRQYQKAHIEHAESKQEDHGVPVKSELEKLEKKAKK